MYVCIYLFLAWCLDKDEMNHEAHFLFLLDTTGLKAFLIKSHSQSPCRILLQIELLGSKWDWSKGCNGLCLFRSSVHRILILPNTSAVDISP